MRREYIQPNASVPTVTNLLPEFIQSNWEFKNQALVNPSYPASKYPGESNVPQGNIMVTYPNGNYAECFTSPISSLYPVLRLEHTYYVRWHSRREKTESGNGSVSGITEDLYWPEAEYGILRLLNNNDYRLFIKNSYTFTLHQSQWPNLVVQDGVTYKIRFDCNNQRKYIRYLVYGDFMLIDLTETYTQQGLPVPSLNTLTAKRYFYGTINLSDWV